MAYRDLINSLRKTGATWRERLDLTEAKTAELDESLVDTGESVEEVSAAADAAQNAADDAQSTADAAQNAADDAQSTADAATSAASSVAARATVIEDAAITGFARNVIVNYARVSLPGDGVAVAIPGPASGFLRCLTQVLVTPDGSSAALVGSRLQPQNMILWKPFSVAQFANPTAGTFLTGNTGGAFLLGFGETYELTNNNGSGAAHILYSYFDFPVGNITLVRTTFGLTPVDLIPVPPAGYFRRIAFVGLVQGATQNGNPRAACIISNVDTAAALVQAYIGANIVTNQGSVSANGLPIFPVNADMAITTEALRVGNRVAVTSSNLNVFAAYETLPIP